MHDSMSPRPDSLTPRLPSPSLSHGRQWLKHIWVECSLVSNVGDYLMCDIFDPSSPSSSFLSNVVKDIALGTMAALLEPWGHKPKVKSNTLNGKWKWSITRAWIFESVNQPWDLLNSLCQDTSLLEHFHYLQLKASTFLPILTIPIYLFHRMGKMRF